MSSRLVTQISLSFTPWRARGQHGAPRIAQERYCLDACARAASRTCSPQCAASSLVAPKTWPPQRAPTSRRPSMRRPIGKLRPGRCRPATQLRRQQLVQNSPARPTRHRLEHEKPRRWIIIIYRLSEARSSLKCNTSEASWANQWWEEAAADGYI